MKVASLTPIRYSYKEDGSLSRDMDRIKNHIVSLKKQIKKDYDLDIYIGDGSRDVSIQDKIKKICKDYGARYLTLRRRDFFNRGLLINDMFKMIDPCDSVLLLDLDLLLDPSLINMFFEKQRISNYKILLAGINFLKIYKIEEDPWTFDVTKDLFKHQIVEEIRRFRTANGLQFIKYSDYKQFGGLDVNFNIYCGTDDEILYRFNRKGPGLSGIPNRAEFCINTLDRPIAFHLNHDSGTLKINKTKEDPKDRFIKNLVCKVNRHYLYNFLSKGKFKIQKNLSLEKNYMCKENGKIFWGNEKEELIPFEKINANLIIKEYIKNSLKE